MQTEPQAAPTDPQAAEAAPPHDTATVAPTALMDIATARITELEAELAEMKERWMRAEAETANVRTRAKRDVDDARQFATQKFARDVAEAAENLKRGLDSIPAAREDEPEIIGKLREGFAGVERSFLALLERNGIVRTDPTGALFNADLHQAMAEQDSHDHPPGTVLQAWTQGWTLHGRLLRPAMVVVAKAPTAAVAPPASSKLDTTA